MVLIIEPQNEYNQSRQSVNCLTSDEFLQKIHHFFRFLFSVG